MLPKRLFPAGTAAGLAAAQALLAQAETPGVMLRLSEPGAFQENYLQQLPPETDRGAAVGAIISGVRLDGPAAPFDPASLRVRLGNVPSEGALCLKVISRDGHYFARGRYNAGNGTEPAPLVEYRTAYGPILANYSNRDIALYAFKSAYCDGQSKVEDQTKAEFFAAQLTPAVSANKLVVQVRAGEARLHAQLWRDEAPISQRVLCNRIQTGPTVGFSIECAITLPERLGLPAQHRRDGFDRGHSDQVLSRLSLDRKLTEPGMAVGGAQRAALVLRGLAYACIIAAIAGLLWLVPAAPTIAVIKATSEFVSYVAAVPELAQIRLTGYALFYEAPGARRPCA